MSKTKLFMGRIRPIFRKAIITNYIYNNNTIKIDKFFNKFLDKNLLNHDHQLIDLNNLTDLQIEIIRKVYSTFLKHNLARLKSKSLKKIRRRQLNLKKKSNRATLVSSENSSTSSNNSLDDFKDNLIKTKNSLLSEDNPSEIKSLDRFSSVISNTKMSKTKQKKIKLNEQELDELYSKNIELIQKDIMPNWNTITSEEKAGICDLLERWQTSLTNSYNRFNKKKPIKSLVLNEDKLIRCGRFDFEKNSTNLKRIQLELYDLSTVTTPDGNKIQPNTRLILRSYIQFIIAFNYLKQARLYLFDSDPSQNKLYWKQMNRFLTCITRGIFRCLFYVHENAKLYKASIGLPPIFFLESDEMDNSEIPSIRMESLSEYAYLCLNRQEINIKLQEEHKHDRLNRKSEIVICTNSTFKLKKYKLILNCLIRLIQVSCMIRDDILLKQIKYDKHSNENQSVDVDIYAHFISANINLIREYLVEILRD